MLCVFFYRGPLFAVDAICAWQKRMTVGDSARAQESIGPLEVERLPVLARQILAPSL